MVKKIGIFLSYFCCLFFISNQLSAQADPNISIRAEVDIYTAVENAPLKGTLTITHPMVEKIDPSSFMLKGKPLEVTYVKSVEVTATTPLEIAIYKFTLPPQTRGLYELPEIAVKIGNNVYRSYGSSYQVYGDNAPQSRPTPLSAPIIEEESPSTDFEHSPLERTAGSKNFEQSPLEKTAGSKKSHSQLVLKSEVRGPDPLFPKQHLLLSYRFYYNGTIDLKTEKLPFLQTADFRKIGDKKVRHYEEDGMAVEEITQEVEAVKPGSFKFPKALIEGYEYKVENNKKVYLPPLLRSELDPYTITVSAFPEEGKPASFAGAVGEFTFATTLLTPLPVFSGEKVSGEKISAGEKMTLAILITGNDLSTVTVPDLNILKSTFELSDLPVIGEVQGKTKRFKVEMIPLSTAVREVPSLTFSYYNPKTKKYIVLKSKPLSLSVLPVQEAVPEEPVKEENVPEPLIEEPDLPVIPASPKTDKTDMNLPLEEKDLHNLPFGSWVVIWIIPIGLGLILAQIYLKRKRDQKRALLPKLTSADYMKKLEQATADSSEFYQLINQTLLTKLTENKHLANSSIAVDDLPRDGINGKVRKFLKEIETQRFSGKPEQISKDQLIANTKKIYNEIPVE